MIDIITIMQATYSELYLPRQNNVAELISAHHNAFKTFPSRRGLFIFPVMFLFYIIISE